jgi:hypothetical protein
MFAFKFQKRFDNFLDPKEFPMNFRMFELLNLIQFNH